MLPKTRSNPSLLRVLNNEFASEFAVLPLNRCRFRYDPPPPSDGRPMILSQARAFAQKTFRVPTGRRTRLHLSERLDDIDSSELLGQLPDDRVKPRVGKFPTPELGIPLWLTLLPAAKPVAIAIEIPEPDKQRCFAALPKDYGDRGLMPDSGGFLRRRFHTHYRCTIAPLQTP